MDDVEKTQKRSARLLVNADNVWAWESARFDEDKPDIASFREPLKNIAGHGRNALDIIARIRPATKK